MRYIVAVRIVSTIILKLPRSRHKKRLSIAELTTTLSLVNVFRLLESIDE